MPKIKFDSQWKVEFNFIYPSDEMPEFFFPELDVVIKDDILRDISSGISEGVIKEKVKGKLLTWCWDVYLTIDDEPFLFSALSEARREHILDCIQGGFFDGDFDE